MKEPKGIVSTEHTVWCCTARRAGVERMPFEAGSTVGHPFGCESYHQTSEPRATSEARRMGWVKTRDFGWLCPPCVRAYLAWKDGQGGPRER